MDVELYALAQELLERSRQALAAAGTLRKLPDPDSLEAQPRTTGAAEGPPSSESAKTPIGREGPASQADESSSASVSPSPRGDGGAGGGGGLGAGGGGGQQREGGGANAAGATSDGQELRKGEGDRCLLALRDGVGGAFALKGREIRA